MEQVPVPAPEMPLAAAAVVRNETIAKEEAEEYRGVDRAVQRTWTISCRRASTATSVAAAASVIQGVFCRDMAAVSNLLSQVGFNRPIPINLLASDTRMMIRMQQSKMIMKTLPILTICSLMVWTAITTQVQAVEFEVTNEAVGTPGSTRFEKEVGIDYGKQTLQSASTFIWQTFKQAKNERKNIQRVRLIVRSMSGNAAASTSNDEISLNANFVENLSGDAKVPVTGVLYHEMTHVWQWNGNGQAPGALIEGIADFVRLKANYADPNWVQPGGGDKWDGGYGVTARFLDYLNGIKDGFVADLNRKMKDGYSENFFVELMGKNVNQLWTEYKAQCGG
ncbi:hypothetical protein H6P81_020549 [Aristolochia fimbriata]|uniref:Uncharacterized protein n=1 Tax=Aristolochia fimbriata TaxID=158543 RepID=A0AAV7DVU5_ARIFI|nr:hypothetical protein H6P81_020549 [Aristolochia fimbriata]